MTFCGFVMFHYLFPFPVHQARSRLREITGFLQDFLSRLATTGLPSSVTGSLYSKPVTLAFLPSPPPSQAPPFPCCSKHSHKRNCNRHFLANAANYPLCSVVVWVCNYTSLSSVSGWCWNLVAPSLLLHSGKHPRICLLAECTLDKMD